VVPSFRFSKISKLLLFLLLTQVLYQQHIPKALALVTLKLLCWIKQLLATRTLKLKLIICHHQMHKLLNSQDVLFQRTPLIVDLSMLTRLIMELLMRSLKLLLKEDMNRHFNLLLKSHVIQMSLLFNILRFISLISRRVSQKVLVFKLLKS
jgi:hypothetical protein